MNRAGHISTWSRLKTTFTTRLVRTNNCKLSKLLRFFHDFGSSSVACVRASVWVKTDQRELTRRHRRPRTRWACPVGPVPGCAPGSRRAADGSRPAKSATRPAGRRSAALLHPASATSTRTLTLSSGGWRRPQPSNAPAR